MSELKSKNKDYHKNWYDRNKKKLSETRKQKYRDNPELQEQAKIRAKQQRQKMKSKKAKLESVKIKGKHYSMYSIHSVATIVGKTSQTLKSWETNGVIPNCIQVGRTRYYNRNQTKLLNRYISLVHTKDKADAMKLLWKNWNT